MKVVFNILYTKFCLYLIFSTQPPPLFVFVQSETGSNNKQDKTKSCKHQSHKGIFVNETDKYIVSLFFDDKGLKLSLLS